VSCRFWHRTCRSTDCYRRTDKRGKETDKSMCEKMYQCKYCRKVMERSKRKPEDHRCGEWKCMSCFRYQFDQNHLCYQRRHVKEPNKTPRTFFFYDFETTQNTKLSCTQGYDTGAPCTTCTTETRCNKCRICVNCTESWCGLEEHKVNFAILQSTCKKCMNEELSRDSKCNICGSRCEKCRMEKPNVKLPPCEETCGYRERLFKGNDTVAKFCDHIMTSHYKNTVRIAHNAKGFDNYPILNALIDYHGVRPDKILYNGSNIIYMHVAKTLDLTFLDSISFIGMPLYKIPECFGFEELRKGYFPHLFNTVENQTYQGPYPE